MKNTKQTMVNEILTHINAAYSKETKPSSSELMALYTQIGEAIASVEESTFAKELVNIIATDCPSVKGFSLRNLSRMRDFYISFSQDADLLADAQTIGWTQNIVIMDKCQSMEEMSFYLALVKEKSLSKAALTVALEEKIFEASKKEQRLEKVDEIKTAASNRKPPVASVCHGKKAESEYTGGQRKRKLTAVMSDIRRFLQGSSLRACHRPRMPYQFADIFRFLSGDFFQHMLC